MKIIRMIKTMSGPQGTFPVGQVRTVDDLTAAMLIGAEAAELIAAVGEPAEPAEAETAAVDPVVETADAPVKARRKKVAQ